MKPDSMLVEPEHIVSARREVASIGSGPSLNQFAHQEPALASFLSENLASFAGRLSLSGAPTELVQGSHEEVLTLVLTCVQSMRRGHYALWKDTMSGSRLAQLEPSLEFKPRPRRKRGQPHSEAQE